MCHKTKGSYFTEKPATVNTGNYALHIITVKKPGILPKFQKYNGNFFNHGWDDADS